MVREREQEREQFCHIYKHTRLKLLSVHHVCKLSVD